MRIAGEATLVAPIEKVWNAVLDPHVLVVAIPGCERLEETGEHAYDMTVTAGVAAIRGTYTGTCTLSDLVEHQSLVLVVQGAGAPGTIGATVDVRFECNDDGTTTLLYDADAVVGGMVGGVGQRMLTSVSRRMATEFFSNIERTIAQGVPGVPPPLAGSTPATEQSAGNLAAEPADRSVAPKNVFTAPTRGSGDLSEFVKGIAVGAGLVALGVVLGSRFGRRR
ncbi:SRPBCC family protein [Nocardioides sp. Root140]|uniref:SRPBCC family protein n=1 Tax=Nocardioides sp. Root140 TaxID=1736460 RepID=UPI0006FB53B6|nr:carbon monoxide dehydrogenase subunit G [Nocardioides sp. Root140]KQY54369.1 carbon monoxide dehydrogenase [Nocardioides sp. Root140]